MQCHRNASHPRPVLLFGHASSSSSSLPPSVPPVVTSKQRSRDSQVRDGVALVLFGLIVLIAPGA
jgi:hypothetical protein